MLLTIYDRVPVEQKTVPQVAKLLRISPQRVRRLLADGRIPGGKHPVTGAWSVPYPFTVRSGKRGPRFGIRPKRHRKAAKRAIVLVPATV